MKYCDVTERKLFWIGFAGGIIRIFGILALIFAAILTMTAIIGDWRPIPLILLLSMILYLLGVELEAISAKATKANEFEDNLKKRTGRTARD